MSNTAVIAVDMQRGFMPAEEGVRVKADGFGELPVADGETIVRPASAFLEWAAKHDMPIATTQDWHPYDTAHFSDTPNYSSTWPRHCVDGTPGAELHPELKVPATARRFLKGDEVLERGEDDKSYSGYYARDPITGLTLPEWLKHRQATAVAIIGLALDYCVGETAYDFKNLENLDVTVITDLTKPVNEKTGRAMISKLSALGVKFAIADEYRRSLMNIHDAFEENYDANA